jgi:CRISPR-associated protein Cas1
MKKLLNTLYVTTQGSYLCHEGEAVLVRVEKETKLRVPIHTLGGIVCFGQVSCSPPLMWLCGERGVAISFLSEQGRFLARVEGPVSGNVLLRREQYRRVDVPMARVEIARGMVLAKVVNCRTVLQRAMRDHDDKPGTEQIERAVRRLGVLQEGIQREQDLAVLRGREGDAANTYFEVMDHLITAQKEDFFFRGRSRRPPLDNMNALLSFTYTLLAHDASSALQAVGLDPQVGFLHAERPGRPSLALDLMEEFRPFLADRLVLSLVNLRQVQGKGFKKTESGAVEMTDETRKELLVAYQKRKQEEIQHPFIGETASVGLLMHLQALLMARHLRGDLDGYPPFVWK